MSLPALFTPNPALSLGYGYDSWLVLLSVSLAVGSAITACQVAGLARRAPDADFRRIAIVTGAIALAGGVWSMHFIGMLALRLCASVHYELGLSALSFVPALLSALVTMHLLVRDHLAPGRLLQGGILMGGGIAVMHYTGMAAMHMAPALVLDPVLLVLALLVAVLLATASLWVRPVLARRGDLPDGVIHVVSGLTMGAAISGMHYLGVEAVSFEGQAETLVPTPPQSHDYLAAIVGLVAVAIAISTLSGNTLLKYRDLLARLRSSEARLQAMFDTAVDGVIVLDEHGRIQKVNRAALSMFGYTAAELVGANVSLLMSAALGDEHDRHLDQFRDRGHSHVIGVSREVAARRKDGSEFPIRLAVGQVQDVQERRFVGFISDITEIKRAQVEREHEATHDALTGLPNRRAFYAILEAALPRADRQGSSLVLMFIDLDGFKAINDGMGHAAGDELLKGVAQRMKEAVRRSDTVARLGGDEFVLLAESVGQAEAGGAELLAEKVLEAVAEPVAGPRGLMQVGASIGVACRMPGSGLGADALVSLADQAMYAAKRAGKHRVVRVQNRRPQDLPAKMPVF